MMSAAPAQDIFPEIVLVDGRTLYEARFVSQTASYVTFRVGSSLQQIDKRLLPPALQTRYPVSPPPTSISPEVSSLVSPNPPGVEPELGSGLQKDRSKQILLWEALHYANDKTKQVYRERNGPVYQVERQDRSWRELMVHFCESADGAQLLAKFAASKERITYLPLSNGGCVLVWQPPVMLLAKPTLESGEIVAWRPSLSLHPLAVVFELGADGKVADWSLH